MKQEVERGIKVTLRIVREGREFGESVETANLRATERDAFNITYSAEVAAEEVPLRSVIANVVIESDHTWFLDDDGQLAPLASSAIPSWPRGRFIVTARDGQLDRWEFPRFRRFRLVRQNGSVLIVAPLLDRSSCGISVWPAVPWAARRDKMVLELVQAPLSHLEECPWIEPYPDGARAVICLTDHADL